jgi:hypothetical protein
LLRQSSRVANFREEKAKVNVIATILTSKARFRDFFPEKQNVGRFLVIFSLFWDLNTHFRIGRHEQRLLLLDS